MLENVELTTAIVGLITAIVVLITTIYYVRKRK